MNFKVLSIGVVLFTLASCTGNNNDAAYQQQQQVAVPAQQQPVQAAPVDSTMAQAQAQAQDPAQAQAATTATAQSLPAPISNFIKQNFPNATIVGVEPDYDHGGMEYDVYLNDGTELDFDANNQWETIESRGKGVPAAFIPKAIATYVSGNYQMPIVKIHKEYYGHEIELSNGMELSFDRQGHFMGMDD